MTDSPNNDKKSDGPLRAGLIADVERLTVIAPTLTDCINVQLLGQAGMPQTAALPGVSWVDDTRVLISQPELRALLVAAAPADVPELLGLADDRGIAAWCLPPLGADFAASTELVRRAGRSETVQRVASWWEYVADQVWNDIAWQADFAPTYCELLITGRGPTAASWRGQPGRAPGGVLADSAYPLLEALIAIRGLPQTVTAATGTYRPPEPNIYSTEDTAAALLRWSDGGIGILRAAWNLPQDTAYVSFHDQRTSVKLTLDEVVVSNNAGAEEERRPLPGDFLGHELLRFADLVQQGARHRAAAPLERHLAVSALLETAYLAARTHHPEYPATIYQSEGWPEPRL